jgi:Tol biopolymer transport system component
VQSVGTPLHGTAVLDGDDIVYTTTPGNLATDKLTYTIVDSTGLTATATVYLGIGDFPTGMPARYVDNVIDASSDYYQVLQQDISREGRYVAYTSKAALTAGDTNNASDVYVFDRMTNTRERISVPTGGGLANGASERPSISADGRYVAFASAATNLVANDTNGTVDVFVRDRVAGTTKRVSVSSTGAQVSGTSRDPDISADGSVIAFASNAFELVPNDANGYSDIFIRDMAAETTTRVSVRVDGGEADQASVLPALSDDGNVVAFVSLATNLVPNDTNAKSDVFVHVRSTNTTERVNVSSTGVEATAPTTTRPAISADGRFVAFPSGSPNLAPGTTSSGAVFVRDRQALTTVVGSSYASGVWLSGDGRYLVANATYTFVRDRFAGQTVNLATAMFPVISANGRYITMISTANLDNEAHGAGAKLYILPNPL